MDPAEDCAVEDRSGRGDPVGLGDLDDPVAAKILRGAPGQGCPARLADVHAKLRHTDASECAQGMFSEVQTILVSERSQLRRTATGSTEGCTGDPIAAFRGVTTRTCDGRPSFALLMAVFGLTVNDQELPEDVELIGFDATRGVFNYYSLEGGSWIFHGDSLDMLAGPEGEGLRRCAACHVGGGLVLKELRSPWVFWEGRDTLPGVADILTAHPLLGSRAQGKVLDLRPAGKELEETIDAGNRAWTKTRVEHLARQAPLREALRPLFCTTEIELRSASETVTPSSAPAGENGTLAFDADELLLDPGLGVEVRLTVPVADYRAALLAAGQRVERACGERLTDAGGAPVIDTVFDLTHPFRSTSDTSVVDALVARGVLDRGLVHAVLGVDVTRPVFSPQRCALLEFVPDLPAPKRNPTAIRRALVSGLKKAEAQGLPGAAQLRQDLEHPEHAAERARAFVQACQARPAAAFVRDLLRDVSRRRRWARQLPIIEMPEMMPVDDYPDDDDGRLDPLTCAWSPQAVTR